MRTPPLQRDARVFRTDFLACGLLKEQPCTFRLVGAAPSAPCLPGRQTYSAEIDPSARCFKHDYYRANAVPLHPSCDIGSDRVSACLDHTPRGDLNLKSRRKQLNEKG